MSHFYMPSPSKEARGLVANVFVEVLHSILQQILLLGKLLLSQAQYTVV